MTPAARLAVGTAALLGLLFPALETLRRGFAAWLTTPVTMLEDYVAGGLLLVAVAAVLSRRPSGWAWVLGASAYATGMMSSSFWKQLEAEMTGVTWEDSQGVVVAVKAILWLAPLLVAVFSARMVLDARPAA